MASTPSRIESLFTGSTPCLLLRSLRLDQAPLPEASTTPPEPPATTVTVFGALEFTGEQVAAALAEITMAPAWVEATLAQLPIVVL
jgi:hypothetical protein